MNDARRTEAHGIFRLAGAAPTCPAQAPDFAAVRHKRGPKLAERRCTAVCLDGMLVHQDLEPAMLMAALCGAIAGSLITGIALYIHCRLVASAHGEDPEGRAREGFVKGEDAPICRYSTHDPMGSAIVRVGRAKH